MKVLLIALGLLTAGLGYTNDGAEEEYGPASEEMSESSMPADESEPIYVEDSAEDYEASSDSE